CRWTFASRRDAQALQLLLDLCCPASIRERARGARVQNRADLDILAAERGTRSALADTDDDARLELSHDRAKRLIAHARDGLLLCGRKLVGCAICAARFHERERA